MHVEGDAPTVLASLRVSVSLGLATEGVATAATTAAAAATAAQWEGARVMVRLVPPAAGLLSRRVGDGGGGGGGGSIGAEGVGGAAGWWSTPRHGRDAASGTCTVQAVSDEGELRCEVRLEVQISRAELWSPEAASLFGVVARLVRPARGQRRPGRPGRAGRAGATNRSAESGGAAEVKAEAGGAGAGAGASVTRGASVVDEVNSYTAFRNVSVLRGAAGGAPRTARLALNGAPCLMTHALHARQGYV